MTARYVKMQEKVLQLTRKI